MEYSRYFVRSVCLLFLVWLCAACRTTTTTPPRLSNAPRYPVRVALVSDTHTSRDTKNHRPWHKPRLEQAIQEVNAAGVDLVLIAGDLTEDGTAQQYRDFRKQIKGFEAPVWYVPGNHDVGNKRLPGKKQAITWETENRFKMHLGPSYWVREHAGLRVIGADGPLFGSGLSRERKMWNTLEEALEKPAPVPTLFMVHYPPFQKSADEPGGVYWNLEPYPRARLLALLKQGGVKTVLSGHLHRSLTNEFDGITLLTTTTVAVGDPKKNPNRGWMLLTVSKDGKLSIEPRKLTDANSTAWNLLGAERGGATVSEGKAR